MSRLDGEARAAQNRRGRAEVLPEKRDVVRVVDRHEVVRGDVETLERQEIERAIPLQRSAERGAVLLLRVRGLLAIDGLTCRIEPLEMILRIERAVAKEEEQVARHRVGAALGHDVDDAAGRLAELGGIRIGEHLEFAHRFLAERRAHAAEGRIVVVEAVDRDVVRSRALAGERQARGARGSLLRRPVGRDAWRQQREPDETSSVDRKTLNLLLRDHGRDDRPLRVDDRRVSRDQHDLLAAGDVQSQADVNQAAERQHDVLEGARREPRQLGADVVGARRERRNQKMSAFVGHARCEPGSCRRSAPSPSHREGRRMIDRRSSHPNPQSWRGSALPRQLKDPGSMPPAQE